MKAVAFPQHTTVLGEKQTEYQNLPAWFGQLGQTEQHTGFLFCHELSNEEMNVINNTKKIWSSQLTFGGKLNPVNMSVYDPFEAEKEFPKETFSKKDMIDFGNFLFEKHAPFNDGVTDADFENFLAK